ncbi:protein-methionine-sulfoxide reductase heme-binding subunit MsrQ [Zoogloea oryzae]|uniref:Protein-methionine-sulfoxide reductase heme-binding subunit MsrQ n=1 Tax=Zoogloea oryzae TaxID=310767 RepID=A0ABQ6FGS3_9RHOO|nr:protein-methionine-sulfoxide reductase heme-binding subunit MsrQ [Zoogloea oryzae]GLT23817.1 protein-methionine-sulfoxide reductase heme-binding subunit MsrQ [Zoogloea oryzae]
MMINPGSTHLAAIKAALFAACLLPAFLLWRGFELDTLGANPIEAITRGTGDWTLRFLLITLAVTPLRKLTGWHWVVRLRRMLGLFAFAYGTAHLLTYLWLDQFFDWYAIARDILKRPFITVGFAALVLMAPLAATSSNAAIRRLGGRRWQALHRAIYPIAVLGCVHFWWLVKKDITEPLIYTAITAALLGIRAWWREQERRKQLAGGYLPQPPRLTGKVIRIFAK